MTCEFRYLSHFAAFFVELGTETSTASSMVGSGIFSVGKHPRKTFFGPRTHPSEKIGKGLLHPNSWTLLIKPKYRRKRSDLRPSKMDMTDQVV